MPPPTKACRQLRAARVARNAGGYGVTIPGEIGVDMEIVRKRAETVIMEARNGLLSWFANMDGITVIYGHARFENGADDHR